MIDRELMQQALDVLATVDDFLFTYYDCEPNNEREIDAYSAVRAATHAAFTALHERLAQPNDFNPDWDAMAVMVEEQQRMAKRIAELEAQPEQEPVAWRDHVEQRLLTWRQSFVNRSGDQLALDDFMDKQSLDDLVDFVCDEYTTPLQRKPLMDEEKAVLRECREQAMKWTVQGRIPECGAFGEIAQDLDWLCDQLAAHGIKGGA